MRALILIAAVWALMSCAPPQSALAQRPSLPSDVSPMELGLRLLRSGEPSLALSAFNRALAQGDVSAEALTGVAVSLHRLGRRKEAVNFLRSAVDLKPNFAIAHNNLGVILYELGDIGGALGEFETAYALTGGEDRDIATNLGIAEMISARQSETVAADTDDFAYDVIQFGHGVYRLEPRSPSEEDPT